MTFLAPAFLFGLAALVAPLLIHLRRRKTRHREPFPSLMFFEEVPHATIRRRRLRDIALWLVRTAAVALLALAFAQPALNSRLLAGGDEGQEHLFVLLDRSASMSDATWSRAQAALAERLGALDEGDRVTAAVFDDSVEILEAETTAATARRLFAETRPRERATSLRAGLEVVRPLMMDAVETVEPADVRLVVMSDFRVPDDALGDVERLPAGARLELIDLAEDLGASNLWVQDVDVQRLGLGRSGADQGRELAVFTAQIGRSDLGSDPVPDGEPSAAAGDPSGSAPVQASVELRLDDRVLQTLTVDVGGRAASVAFDQVSLDPERTTRGEIRLSPDSFRADDRYFFTVTPGDVIDVLVVERGGDRAGLYVRRALAASRDPRYRVRTIRPGALADQTLLGIDVLVVPDGGVLGSAAGPTVERYVGGGGGLLVGLGNQSMGRPLVGVAEIRRESEVSQSRRGVQLATLERGHPAFEGAPDLALGGAPFFRHFRLDDGGGAVTLARFDNGDPALVEVDTEAGRVIVFASTLDTSWNDFPRQASFLALTDRLLRYLGRYRAHPSSYGVGQPALVDVGESSTEQLLVVNSEGESERITVSERTDRQAVLTFETSGHHSVRSVGADTESARWFASNLDRDESANRRLDLEVLQARLEPAAADASASQSGGSAEPAAPRSSFWWLLAYALLLLALGEVIVAGRGRRGLRFGAAG